MVLRSRRGVMRLTAAVLRKRLALPRVGELSQPGRGRGSAPPMARACIGRCGRERGSEASLASKTRAYVELSRCTGLGDGAGGGHASIPCSPSEKALAYTERSWTWVIPLPTG